MGFTDSLADYFGFEEHNTDVRTEVIGGITTFLAMSYIVVVNPSVLAATHNPDGSLAKPGIAIAGYTDAQTVQMIAVVTLVASAVAMLVMAFYANRPFGLAPGLGLNAFFAFTVVNPNVLGISWQTALAAVVTEGVIFILLTAVGAREYVINLFPEPVKFAVGTGIGLFLAIIGLQAMGIVVNSGATLVTLGPVASDPRALLAVLGLLLTLALYARGVKGSIVIGILSTTAVALVLTLVGVVTPTTLIGGWAQPGGFDASALPQAQYDISPLVGAFAQGFGNIEAFGFALIVFTFFFVDFFDTAGTLVGVGQAGGFLDDEGDLPDADKPLMADAIGTTVGGMLGTSTVTTYVESATGVEEGGRTGMVALVVALLFLVSLVVVPLAAAIPQYVSHIALVVVAILMLSNVTAIDWDDLTHAIPAGLTILVMPFTYSIAYGIAAGIISYPIVKTAVGDYDEVRLGQWLLALAFVVYFFVRTSGILQSTV
ncbi:NCS2 family permease [Halarchaeum salinum]|uniref:NCS2 family permease n=1 Tax=Halarchaeum salinum TaxID=489912 RepID=A0AAV3SA33_9EURY